MRSVTTSRRLFAQARERIPDGVSSPMRAFRQVSGTPICAAHASGSKIFDADGNAYVDFLNCFGALILGHARREIVEAISAQSAKGTAYGLSTELELALAGKIVASTPCIDQVRFVCSGSEAVMTAVRIARAHTGRPLILKFRGAYHGHADALLANPDHPNQVDGRKGTSAGLVAQRNVEVVLADYNDPIGVEKIFTEHGSRIAAVVVEPFATNMGFVKPKPGFHELLRSLSERHGSLLIFDEVVTGFRFRFGAACTAMGIEPDLVTFGKIIGGGTPVGAYAGKKHLMSHVAIGRDVFQSGTFASNPLTMAAGNAALDVLSSSGFYEELERKGALLERAIAEQFVLQRVPFLFTRHGVLCGVAFRKSKLSMASYQDVKGQRYDVFRAVHTKMLDRGFLLPPSLEEPLFLSQAHSDRELEELAAALAHAIRETLDELGDG
jgi:glutamate-1-semialdehyde 2,1-aminomutase